MRTRSTLAVASILLPLFAWTFAAAQPAETPPQKKHAVPAAAQKARAGAPARPALRGAPAARQIPGVRPGVAPRGVPGAIRQAIPHLPGGVTLPRGPAIGAPALPRGPAVTLPRAPAAAAPRNANLGAQPKMPGAPHAPAAVRGPHVGPNAKTALPRPGAHPNAAGAKANALGARQAGRGGPARAVNPQARGPNAVTASRHTALPRPGAQRPLGRQGLGPGNRGAAWQANFQRRYIPPPRSPGPPPGFGIARTAHEMAFSGVPPLRETRFVSNEVVVQVSNTVPRAQVEEAARRLGIAIVDAQSFDAAGRVVYQFRSPGGRNVREVIRSLEQNRIVASAQPNYVYNLVQSGPATLAQGAPAEASPAASSSESGQPAASEVAARETLPPGDASQYTIEKLHLGAIHREARGRNVAVAVIDSEIDAQHPDLKGAVKERFDATKTRANPHAHGTGMAGAIAAKARLLGVAPGANILAIKAFGENNASAEATSFQILQGLDYAMRRGVRVINMSFAGPYDVMMERKLREAYEAGIVLIAAAGNAGPKSPPLYPAADPNVIAVTATDASDKPFDMANRGKHIAVAAPGVDILAPAPRGEYQLTTGTSVAAAHVSGVVALLLEKRPGLTPDDVRAILTGSARPIMPDDKANQTGAGLVDPVQALAYDPAQADAPQEASTGAQQVRN